MKEIQIFHDALKDVSALAADIQAKNRKIIGSVCSYAPEELIYAAGFHPMRLFSSKSTILLAENHLQSYCCSLVRGVLEDSLSGRLDFLDGTVFPHTCDSIQRLSDIFRMNNRYAFFADVILPAKLNTPSARIYLTEVLTQFKKDLEAATGKTITDADLEKSIRLFNQIRKTLSRIFELNARHPGILPAADLYALVKGTMVMDKDTAAGLLSTIFEALTPGPVKNTGKRVVLTGSVCDAPDIYAAIENAGAVIVGDDLCTGQRWFEGLIDETVSPLPAIAERYLDRITCPAKHTTLTARGENMVSLAKRNKADGVVFLLMKFCDPHAFDYPYVKDFLDRENIKSLLLEMDDQQQNPGQLSTRIETFIHMI